MLKIHNPKVSIVIPVYNASSTIIKALESVKGQGYKEYEIIIINDGSNDNSDIIISDFIKNNNFLDIKYINQINQGVSKSRNIGMKYAEGDFIALLDSDDVWLPNKLEMQIKFLTQNPDIDFLGTNRNGEIFKRFLNIKFQLLTRITAKNLLYKMFFITPTVIFKKNILEDVGFFDENMRFAEDAEYFIRIAQRKKCFLLNVSLVLTDIGKTHFGQNGLSSNLFKMHLGELSNLRRAYKDFVINFFEYFFVFIFLQLKFIRRALIIKLRF